MGLGYSERVASEIDAEVQEILNLAEQRAREALELNRAAFERVANRLIEVETLEDEALDELLLDVTQTGPTEATVSSMR
jgi:cell division protease FtsH